MIIGIIYKYENILNHKVYIGQTINEEKRIQAHRNAVIEKNPHFHAAIQKYGFENFNYEVLFRIQCELLDYIKIVLDEMEMYYINKFNSTDPTCGYNITSGGGGTIGYKLSEEHKKRLSDVMKSKHIHLSKEQIIALQEKRKEVKFIKGKAINRYDLQGNFKESYMSMMDAARKFKCNAKSLSRAMTRKHNTGIFKGYLWKFE